MVVADAGKHADASLAALRVVACVLERLMGEFEKDALLRVHDLGFQRIDAKESGIEKVGALDQTAGADVIRIAAQMFVNAWAEFLGRKERNGFDGVAKVAPEFIEIGRAGETAGHADDRNGIADSVIRIVRTARRVMPRMTPMTRPAFGFGKNIGLGLVHFQKFRELCDGGVLKDLDRGNLARKTRVILTCHADRCQRIAT